MTVVPGSKATPFEILVVEDNPGDARLIQKGLEQWRRPYQPTFVMDGAAAIACLRDGMVPDLVLLDWNLPGVSGREVLHTIKNMISLQKTRTIVFTSSVDSRDQLDATVLRADGFVIKPITLDEFFEEIGRLENFCYL